MKIIGTEQEIKQVTAVCDAALKMAGIEAMKDVLAIQSGIMAGRLEMQGKVSDGDEKGDEDEGGMNLKETT